MAAMKFLQLARKAIDKAVKELAKGENGKQLKLNKLQCKLVVEKLSTQTQEVLNSVELSLDGPSAVSIEPFELALKELYRVVTDALSLIKESCCGQKWLIIAIKQHAGNNVEDFAKILYEIEWSGLILCSIISSTQKMWSAASTQTVIFEAGGCDGKLGAFDLFKLERASTLDRESFRLDLEDLRQDHVCDSSREACVRFQTDACLAAQLLENLDELSAGAALADMARENNKVPSLWKVDPRDLLKGKSLGRGSFGKVNETKWLGEPFAKKIFPHIKTEGDIPTEIDHDTTRFWNPSFKTEVDNLTRICHPNVMRTVCWSEDKDKGTCSLVMDLMDGDLAKFLCSHGTVRRLKIHAAVGLMLQIAEGMKYLHGTGRGLTRGLVHRDLKSFNILVKALTDAPELQYNEGYLNAKVTDFGEAKIKNFGTRYSTQTHDVGTRLWMAPEIITDDEDSDQHHGSIGNLPFQVDVYSFAIVCSELLTGKTPYASERLSMGNLLKQITKHHLRPQLPQSCPTRLVSLIQSCWEDNPRERPTFSEICKELRYIKGLIFRGDEEQLEISPIFMSTTTQILGPWGSPPTSGTSFCDYHGGATHITGFTIRYSTTHKAIWCLTVNYVIRGQPFQYAHGSQSGNPNACETEVIKFNYPSEYLIQIEGSYGITPALIGSMVFLGSDTTVGPENRYTVIASLTFKSNIKTYGPYGVIGDKTFKTHIGRIRGLFGRAGACLDCFGVFIDT